MLCPVASARWSLIASTTKTLNMIIFFTAGVLFKDRPLNKKPLICVSKLPKHPLLMSIFYVSSMSQHLLLRRYLCFQPVPAPAVEEVIVYPACPRTRCLGVICASSLPQHPLLSSYLCFHTAKAPAVKELLVFPACPITRC